MLLAPDAHGFDERQQGAPVFAQVVMHGNWHRTGGDPLDDAVGLEQKDGNLVLARAIGSHGAITRDGAPSFSGLRAVRLFSTSRRLANCVRFERRQASEREMRFFPQSMRWRTWRLHPALAVMMPTRRSFTLGELLKSLELSRDSVAMPSPYLERLAALVKQDLATAERFPEQRGGPATRRSLAVWRMRYNHLDRYLLPEAAAEAIGRCVGPDDVGNEAESAAENEGWPLRETRRDHPVFQSSPTGG